MLFTAIGQTQSSDDAFDHSHAALTAALKKHVKNGKVDYAALKKNQTSLNTYLDSLATVSKKEFWSWKKNQEIAYLINLYNAATLKLIIDHYPVDSIKDIGGFINGPWEQNVVRLFGNKVTLDFVEHEMLRKYYNEPRIHFAVNCASIGCPVLRAEAYQATKLDNQLDEQGREFLRNDAKNRVNTKTNTLHLSPVFDWFAGDFKKKSGSVQKFILPYLHKKDRAAVKKQQFDIDYTDYSWKLNKQ